ncbi:MAG: TorF family putative porin [Pseudomonadota bacterium]|nr:TorF family putative porin [Pseudomonadota bacterium]
MRAIALLPCSLALLLAVPAAAQEDPLSISLGAAITSDYVFRGISQTDKAPAFQPYAEAEYALPGDFGSVYAGFWGSNVDFGEFEVEMDFYGGYRNSFRGIDYDIGYVRYVYTDSGDCCGEAYVSADYQINDAIGVGGAYYHDFDLETDYVTGSVTIALFWELELSGGVGKFADGGASDWNVGLSRPITDTISADVRFHDSSQGEWLVNATISFDTDWASLMGR